MQILISKRLPRKKGYGIEIYKSHYPNLALETAELLLLLGEMDERKD